MHAINQAGEISVLCMAFKLWKIPHGRWIMVKKCCFVSHTSPEPAAGAASPPVCCVFTVLARDDGVHLVSGIQCLRKGLDAWKPWPKFIREMHFCAKKPPTPMSVLVFQNVQELQSPMDPGGILTHMRWRPRWQYRSVAQCAGKWRE
jgi:hypothetical protein